MLRASVRAFLAEHASVGATRAVYASGERPHEVWDGLAELGVLDLEMVDAAVVLEELGRVVCRAPYASSAVGARSLLPELGDGRRVGTLAVLEAGARCLWGSPATRASRVGPGW